GEAPARLAFNSRIRTAADGAGAFGAQNVVRVFVVAADHLPVRYEGPHAVRIDVVDLEVVENIAAFGRDCAAADADAAHRRLVVHEPGNFVDAVNRLFDEAVAAEPDEVVPVADLPLDVAHSGRTRAGRRHRLYRVGVICRIIGDGFTDRAAFHLRERLEDLIVVSPAEAGDQRQVFGARFLGGFKHGADT